MARWDNHMKIGAACGATLPAAVALGGATLPITSGLWLLDSIVLAAATAVLATIPDIDEPRSWISRHVRLTALACGALLGVVLALRAATLDMAAANMLAAFGLGALLGASIPPLMRWLAGGHRRFTHSLTAVAVLLLLAGLLFLPWYVGDTRRAWWTWLWLVPAAMGWGIVAHLPGDLVTPAGVPLLYPFRRTAFHLLPKFGRRKGERWAVRLSVLVAVLAVGAAALRGMG